MIPRYFTTFTAASLVALLAVVGLLYYRTRMMQHGDTLPVVSDPTLTAIHDLPLSADGLSDVITVVDTMLEEVAQERNGSELYVVDCTRISVSEIEDLQEALGSTCLDSCGGELKRLTLLNTANYHLPWDGRCTSYTRIRPEDALRQISTRHVGQPDGCNYTIVCLSLPLIYNSRLNAIAWYAIAGNCGNYNSYVVSLRRDAIGSPWIYLCTTPHGRYTIHHEVKATSN